jgi:hypothetical protein
MVVATVRRKSFKCESRSDSAASIFDLSNEAWPHLRKFRTMVCDAFSQENERSKVEAGERSVRRLGPRSQKDPAIRRGRL